MKQYSQTDTEYLNLYELATTYYTAKKAAGQTQESVEHSIRTAQKRNGAYFADTQEWATVTTKFGIDNEKPGFVEQGILYINSDRRNSPTTTLEQKKEFLTHERSHQKFALLIDLVSPEQQSAMIDLVQSYGFAIDDVNGLNEVFSQLATAVYKKEATLLDFYLYQKLSSLLDLSQTQSTNLLMNIPQSLDAAAYEQYDADARFGVLASQTINNLFP